jgi:hypothetical protein
MNHMLLAILLSLDVLAMGKTIMEYNTATSKIQTDPSNQGEPIQYHSNGGLTCTSCHSHLTTHSHSL